MAEENVDAGTEAGQAAGAPEAAGEAGGAPSGSGEGAPPAPDLWEPFDRVLQAFGDERHVGVGTYWGERADDVEGRFAGWANSCGWRCTLQLVRAPEEHVVVLVAQGPPLPGGRARVMVLGAFPSEFDPETFRAALEVGYGIGETWGPAEEPAAATGEPPAEPTRSDAP